MTSCRHVELVDESKRLSLAPFVRPPAIFDFTLVIPYLEIGWKPPTRAILDPLSDFF